MIVDSFDRIKNESDGKSATMTAEQQQWVDTMQALANQQPDKGGRPLFNNALGRMLFRVVTSYIFDGLIMFVIVANIGVMASSYWRMERDEEVAKLHHDLMSVFGYIYYAECILKLSALGPSFYFNDSWCRFDFFLICVSLFEQFFTELFSSLFPIPPFLLRVLRVFRILRILRLLKGAKDLRNLIVTLILSFPALMNIAGLLTLVIFIYSVLGVQLFSSLAHQESIDAARNFETLPRAALLLYQVMTGDAWSGMMSEATVSQASGFCDEDRGDCGTWLAIPYFISFQLLATFVFLNLVVAVILENFSSLGALDPNLVSASDIDSFKEVWSELDPDADNYIPSKELITLVLRVPPPLGLNGAGDFVDAQRMCLKLSVSQVGGKVEFKDVLSALTKFNFSKKASGDTSEIFKLDVPKPVSSAAFVPPTLKRQQTNSVDKFASDLPSVRKVFALEVISKHLAKSGRCGGAFAKRFGAKKRWGAARDASMSGELPVPEVPKAGYIDGLDYIPGSASAAQRMQQSSLLRLEGHEEETLLTLEQVEAMRNAGGGEGGAAPLAADGGCFVESLGARWQASNRHSGQGTCREPDACTIAASHSPTIAPQRVQLAAARGTEGQQRSSQRGLKGRR